MDFSQDELNVIYAALRQVTIQGEHAKIVSDLIDKVGEEIEEED